LASEPDELAHLARHDAGIADAGLADKDLPEIVRKIRARTPARLLAGRAGTGYRTVTQMELREAHAAARDAVRAELDLHTDLDRSVVGRWNLFEVCTQATGKAEYLLRPDLGRIFSADSRADILRRCPDHSDLQIVIGDGLSVTAVRAQVPHLLPLLHDAGKSRGWTVGQTFVVRHCRVGILNEVGELLAPEVAILLIGERPGLATAESLSAYMAYQPRSAHTDADRNLISNIHSRGVSTQGAVARIINLSAQMMAAQKSGYLLREEHLGLNKA
jgi:ethanolamine ammonia-lyase small subunit